MRTILSLFLVLLFVTGCGGGGDSGDGEQVPVLPEGPDPSETSGVPDNFLVDGSNNCSETGVSLPRGVHDFSYEGGGWFLDDDGTYEAEDVDGRWTWSQDRCFCVQPYGLDFVICNAVGNCQSCFDETDSTAPTYNPSTDLTGVNVDDVCSDPVLTTTAPLPRGYERHPREQKLLWR